MGLKDKLKQRAAKKPPRVTLEVYTEVRRGDQAGTFVPMPTITGNVRCGYHKPEPDARVEYQGQSIMMSAAVPAPFFLKLGNEYLEIPTLTTEAGTLPLCDRCANQLKCLERGRGGIITPEDIL